MFIASHFKLVSFFYVAWGSFPVDMDVLNSMIHVELNLFLVNDQKYYFDDYVSKWSMEEDNWIYYCRIWSEWILIRSFPILLATELLLILFRYWPFECIISKPIYSEIGLFSMKTYQNSRWSAQNTIILFRKTKCQACHRLNEAVFGRKNNRKR